MSQQNKNVLIYGGSGQLGTNIVQYFNSKGWSTFSVDFKDNPQATWNSALNAQSSTKDNTASVTKALKTNNVELHAVICVAGGWLMGSVKDDSIFEGVDKMFNFNVQSAIAASHLAANFLQPGGLLVLTGAQAALGPTPSMVAYGITKAATHHLIASIAGSESGVPQNTSVVGIVPICLDTATNRQSMPNANFANWTPLSELADKLYQWSEGKDRPTSGTLVTVETKDSKTTYNSIPASSLFNTERTS
eukprot:TRINITY_DN8791_c0_g1_i1.p1 TRINITY_DN8791_c0_g1~~TRINITY_DN8791_c0_g1_i1.p1  ORF type:complete len:248 (+),score=41.73 TRINITY_DN8791_c0_g1_i1:23-766(+)